MEQVPDGHWDSSNFALTQETGDKPGISLPSMLPELYGLQ